MCTHVHIVYAAPMSAPGLPHADDPRTQYERMVDGDYYIADDPRMAVESQRANRLCAEYLAAYAVDVDAAQTIVADLIGDLAPSAHIKPPLAVDYGSFISVGEGSFINSGLTALDVARITIGRDVQIGPNVQLLTPIHPLESGPRRAKLEAAQPITIEDNVWLGGGVIVLPGVRIGANSVIGAGSVVTKDVPPFSLAVGNPARVIRELE